MLIQKMSVTIFARNRFFVDHIQTDNNVLQIPATNMTATTPLTLSIRAEYIYSAASQATSPAPFKYLFNKYPY
jgi:hypothetical protein